MPDTKITLTEGEVKAVLAAYLKHHLGSDVQANNLKFVHNDVHDPKEIRNFVVVYSDKKESFWGCEWLRKFV